MPITFLTAGLISLLLQFWFDCGDGRSFVKAMLFGLSFCSSAVFDCVGTLYPAPPFRMASLRQASSDKEHQKHFDRLGLKVIEKWHFDTSSMDQLQQASDQRRRRLRYVDASLYVGMILISLFVFLMHFLFVKPRWPVM